MVCGRRKYTNKVAFLEVEVDRNGLVYSDTSLFLRDLMCASHPSFVSVLLIFVLLRLPIPPPLLFVLISPVVSCSAPVLGPITEVHSRRDALRTVASALNVYELFMAA